MKMWFMFLESVTGWHSSDELERAVPKTFWCCRFSWLRINAPKHRLMIQVWCKEARWHQEYWRYLFDDAIPAASCPHSVATSSDFMFWHHCLHVSLRDMSLPLEATVSTVSVTLSKWKREIQTEVSRGTKEQDFLLDLCCANSCLPVQLQLCFSWQCNSVSIQSDYFPFWILQSFFFTIGLSTVGNT